VFETSSLNVKGTGKLSEIIVFSNGDNCSLRAKTKIHSQYHV
jgi:hypothetical protein